MKGLELGTSELIKGESTLALCGVCMFVSEHTSLAGQPLGCSGKGRLINIIMLLHVHTSDHLYAVLASYPGDEHRLLNLLTQIFILYIRFSKDYNILHGCTSLTSVIARAHSPTPQLFFLADQRPKLVKTGLTL